MEMILGSDLYQASVQQSQYMRYDWRMTFFMYIDLLKTNCMTSNYSQLMLAYTASEFAIATDVRMIHSTALCLHFVL